MPIRFVNRVRGEGKMGPREVLHGVFSLLRLRADLARDVDSGRGAQPPGGGA